MAEHAQNEFSLASLYESHPHILTEIMYHCSPTTFDAFRYTCKAVYSMSLDPDLLEYHLKTILDRHHELITHRPSRFFYDVVYMDTKLDTLENARGNLWRLRGLILQEFLRMQSSWRVGDYKKVVVELDVHPEEEGKRTKEISGHGPYFDGTIHVFFGPVRGSTFAVSWGDRERTRLHTYHFTNSKKYAMRKIDGPRGTRVVHNFSSYDKKYLHTTFETKPVGRRAPVGLTTRIDDQFNIAITEGSYKRDPTLQDRNYYISEWYGHADINELNSTFLRVKFHEMHSDGEAGAVDLAYELNWERKRSWKVPAMSMSNAPNVLFTDHSEENMKLLLGKDGKCESEGYAIGMDSSPRQKWKVLEPRRLEEDISRLGVWRDVSVEFLRAEDGNETILRVLATVSKNLIKPDPEKRFLLTNSKILNPNDWVNAEVSLVLPPVTRGSNHGKLVLATVAPAAYFRRRTGMRDPEIPWADQGFMNYDWNTKKDPEGLVGPQPLMIRTGAMIRRELLDAEIVTRIVGWTDDGAVWVWDISEKHILDAGELAMPQESKKALEVAGRKLGYVKDVKGILVTGDRLVQKITLFTYGKEQRVHRVGGQDSGENDSGISYLRQEDIMRKIARAKARRDSGQRGSFQSNHDSHDGDGEPAGVRRLEVEDGTVSGTSKWRMIVYSFGEAKGGGSANYRIDPSGDLEDA
ncbi:hypothetical protein TWF281_008680 [Arthrobotrys megalospora]